MEDVHYEIFKRGSKTYFFSSLFFPKEIREDVFVLYSFVRKADDFVDSVPQMEVEFNRMREDYHQALDGARSGDVVVDSFVKLMEKRSFEEGWVDAFLRSMSMDLHVNEYGTLEELDTYLYGSSEVIGLMMAAIMGLPDESHRGARHLGKAMQ
jgi:phytoene synthase